MGNIFPVELRKPTIKPKSILKVPSHTLTPYNAQATLHFQDAFWGLYLPITVAGRVSDIWRSYIVQALFKRLGLHLGFLPRPIVVQDRNPHSYEADFNAEIPLYTKSSFLISYLADNYIKDNNSENQNSFIELLEGLWIDMYERGIVEEEDVLNIQEWISDLLKVGYKFPTISLDIDSNPNGNSLRNNTTITSHERTKLIKNISSKGNKINAKDKPSIDKCNNGEYKITFGSSDLDDQPKIEYSSILTNIGQRFVNVGPRTPSYNYPNMKNVQGWILANENPSYPMKVYITPYVELDPAWPEINKKHYMEDKIVNKIDAFICSFPASMCQLWEPFNKTIIFLPDHRYNLGRCSEKEWKKLDKFVNELYVSEPNSGNTIGAASRYDMEYMKYYTGISSTLIPSFAGFYIPSDKYKPHDDNPFAVISHSTYFIDMVHNNLQLESNAINVYTRYAHYKQQDTGQHKAVILFPDSVMSRKYTEIYASTTPIFAPSPKFFMDFYDPRNKQYGLGSDRTSTSNPNCQRDTDIEEKVRPLPKSTKRTHVYSPNIQFLQDAESEQYWIQFSDFYDWPHVQHFDSLQHLKELLFHSDINNIHNSMKEEMILRENQVTYAWCQIVNRIDKHRVKSAR